MWTWRLVGSSGAALTVAASLYLIAAGEVELWNAWGTPFAALFSLFFAPLVWVVIPRQPSNHLLWVLAVSALFWGIYAAGAAALAITYPGDATRMLVDPHVRPVDLPRLAAWVMTFTYNGWLPGLFPLVTLGLLLFPDGEVPSRRWRWLPPLTVTGIALSMAASWWAYRPSATVPYNRGAFEDPLFALLVVGGLATVAASFGALLIRFRRSRAETRQQFKWVVWGGTVFVLGVFAAFTFEGTRYQLVSDILFIGGGTAFVASYGIAVGKYRLHDVDVVISRSLVYGFLAVFITGVYVAAVLGVGSVVGGDAESSPWLAIGATALVAYAFEPLRGRLHRLANRLVYGRRATPYQVLSDFSHRIGADEEELLGQVARSLAEGTTASAASVWVTVNGSLARVAAWPETLGTGDVPLDGRATPPGDVLRPVLHDGEELGVLALSLGRGQSMMAPDERLLDQVASGMGLALRNLRLGEDLRRQVDELGRSRHRLLAIQDETRRQLERELHDGAQQRLVALKVRLAVARARAGGDSELAALLEQVAADTGRAVDSLRDLARGIYPPLLEAEGLRAALTAQIQALPLPITLDVGGLPRFSPEMEAAVYFCVLEALQNVVKHARADSARVLLRHANHQLSFQVSDDGEGFDPAAVTPGSGLTNLRGRLHALDGTIHIDSAPGRGTTIRGTIPVLEPERAK